MYDYLPGTVIELDHGHDINEFFKSLFAAGGLVLSQVLSLTGLSTHTVQNWVKRKYLKPPVNKKYDCNQFCTIAIMNMLSGTFSLDNIRRLIDYAELLDEDAAVRIYTFFVHSIGEIGQLSSVDGIICAIDCRIGESGLGDELQSRLGMVVKIMVIAHLSSVIKLSAQDMLNALDV